MNPSFDIQPFPPRIDADLVRRLARVEPATVGHYRHHGFVDPDLRAVVTGRHIAGTAVTVRIAGADSTLLHHAMGHVREGDIVFIDRCGDDLHACWGGALTVAAKARGIAGVVIDGRATDFAEIRRLDLPLWCRGPSPVTTKLLTLGGAMNVPVTVGGITVTPGDAVIADENGIVVLGVDEAAQWADLALTDQEEEIPFNEALARGERLGTLSGATAMIEEAAGITLSGD